MLIKELPELMDRKKILTMTQDQTVFEAVNSMNKCRCGSVVIINNNNKILGIFTERDILTKVVAQKHDVKKLTLKKVMSKNINTAKLDDLISNSLRKMTEAKTRHLPIIDDKHNLVSLVSQGDLVAYSWPHLFHILRSTTKSAFLANTQAWLLPMVLILWLITMAIIIMKL